MLANRHVFDVYLTEIDNRQCHPSITYLGLCCVGSSSSRESQVI